MSLCDLYMLQPEGIHVSGIICMFALIGKYAQYCYSYLRDKKYAFSSDL